MSMHVCVCVFVRLSLSLSLSPLLFSPLLSMALEEEGEALVLTAADANENCCGGMCCCCCCWCVETAVEGLWEYGSEDVLGVLGKNGEEREPACCCCCCCCCCCDAVVEGRESGCKVGCDWAITGAWLRVGCCDAAVDTAVDVSGASEAAGWPIMDAAGPGAPMGRRVGCVDAAAAVDVTAPLVSCCCCCDVGGTE